MNERVAQAAGCDGKRGFTTPQLAHKAAGRKNGRGIYKCRFCGSWHVGNVAKNDNARPVRR